MNEAAVTIKWKHFIQSHPPLSTETYELKFVDIKKQRKFYFDKVKDHQYLGLMTSLDGLWHKIADTVSSNGGSMKKPFDAIWIKAYEAYVVVVFYNNKYFTKALKMSIKNFIIIKNTWKQKSISMDDLEKQLGVTEFYI